MLGYKQYRTFKIDKIIHLLKLQFKSANLILEIEKLQNDSIEQRKTCPNFVVNQTRIIQLACKNLHSIKT
jgi:hypothetical protein